MNFVFICFSEGEFIFGHSRLEKLLKKTKTKTKPKTNKQTKKTEGPGEH